MLFTACFTNYICQSAWITGGNMIKFVLEWLFRKGGVEGENYRRQSDRAEATSLSLARDDGGLNPGRDGANEGEGASEIF